MYFDQSSPVQPNPEKKIWKNLEKSEKINCLKKYESLKKKKTETQKMPSS